MDCTTVSVMSSEFNHDNCKVDMLKKCLPIDQIGIFRLDLSSLPVSRVSCQASVSPEWNEIMLGLKAIL